MTDMLVRCGVCGKTKPDHHGMAHQFNADGALIPTEPQQKPPAISGLDIPLRLLLIDKGLITAEELTLKEVALRDQLARSARPPQRDNR